MKQRALVLLAALGFLAAAAYEGLRDTRGQYWSGYSPTIIYLGLIYVPLWTAAAVGLLLRFRWGWLTSILAGVLVMVHGFAINLGGSKQGLPFALGGIAIILLLVFGRPWNNARKKTKHATVSKLREREPSISDRRAA